MKYIFNNSKNKTKDLISELQKDLMDSVVASVIPAKI